MIPELTPEMVNNGTIRDHTGRHTLLGWIDEVFTGLSTSGFNFKPAAERIIRQQIGIGDTGTLSFWNSTHSLEEVAAAWNACRPALQQLAETAKKPVAAKAEDWNN